MTTINDRITRLEDAFSQVVPLLEGIAATQVEQTAVLGQHTGKLDSYSAVLDQHTDKLDAIIAALNEQSIDIALIKGHIG